MQHIFYSALLQKYDSLSRRSLVSHLGFTGATASLVGCAPKDTPVIEEPSFHPAAAPSPQSRSTRAFRTAKYDPVRTIVLAPQLRFAKMAIDAGGALYALDRSHGHLYVFPEPLINDKHYILKLEAASKLRKSIIDFALDLSSKRVFALTSEQLWTFTNSGPEQLGELKGVDYFVVHGNRLIYLPFPSRHDSGSFLWATIEDLTNEKPAQAPPLVTQPRKHLFAVLGKMHGDSAANRFAYVSDRCGYLIGLADHSSGPRLSFARKTIDATPIPKLEKPKPNITRIPFGQPVVGVAVCVEKDRLALVSQMPAGAKQVDYVLDTYDSATGDYKYSDAIQLRASGIALSAPHVFLSINHELHIWREPSS